LLYHLVTLIFINYIGGLPAFIVGLVCVRGFLSIGKAEVIAVLAVVSPFLWSAVKTLVGLVRYLRKHSPEALMSTLTGANLIAVLACLLSGKNFRLILREATSLANVRSRMRRILMRALYRYADKIIVLTDVIKDEMVSDVNLPVEKTTVIGNPVDCERIRELSYLSDSDENICELRPYVVVVGRLVETKDLFTVIEAFARISHECLLNLVIIGEGVQKSSLEQFSHELGVNVRVFFLGSRSNPYQWIRCAEVFVLSSKWEGYPNVLLEAMCFSRPIVATKVSGVSGIA
jgi:glycosyltransferase involved in cell wall biosynthesis